MDFQEEIFESFLKKISKDSQISKDIVDKLKDLWKEGRLGTKDEIYKLLTSENKDEF